MYNDIVNSKIYSEWVLYQNIMDFLKMYCKILIEFHVKYDI